MFCSLIWLLVLLCRSSAADENSIRDTYIFPSSPEILRGTTLKLFCVLGNHYTPPRNASHIIWKLNHKLIAQENYDVVNETVSSVTIHNFTYDRARVRCFINYLGKEQLLVHTEAKSAFPPDRPGNISCIYYFDVKLACNWTSGRQTNLQTNYTLYRKMMSSVIVLNTGGFSCQRKTESCSFFYLDIPFSSSFCFQVKAGNALGETVSKCVPIPMEKIEKFDPLEILSVQKIAGVKQLLAVSWKKTEIIPFQDLNCWVQYRNLYLNSSETVTVRLTSGEKISLNLTDLWDSTEYAVAVQCVSVESQFSEWSREKTASTEEKAPVEKLDLWRVIESSHSSRNRTMHLMWKPLNHFLPSGKILGYAVQYFLENSAALKMMKITTDKKIILFLNEEAYIVSVTAYNSAGDSPAATLRIPSTDEKTSQVIESVRTFTADEEMVVEWMTSRSERSRYVVEWQENLEMDSFHRSWQYVSNSTNWRTNKKTFKPFVCYNISVYPLYENNVGAPYSIQTYIQEKKPSEGPMTDTSIPGKNEITIKWKEVSKDKRNGFITNYTIFYKPEDGEELNETVNADVLQYRLKSLQADTKYTVHIMATNAAGGTSGEPKTFKTLKFNKDDIISIAIPVGLSMLFLLVLWITCILKKHMLNKYTDVNTKDTINLDEKIPCNEGHEVTKPLSPSMPYTTTDQDFSSQVQRSPLMPTKEIPVEMPEGDIHEFQHTSHQTEEREEEVSNLLDFNEKAVFNPYLKNSVNTKEFIISESLPEHNRNEPKSQSIAISPLQPNILRQSYVTLDMFELATAH
ncbi:LOW QUALITY PROTEIN: interleukin-31 receptor subunit alpha-like [Eudromia elegans]